MKQLRMNEASYQCAPDESVLDALLRQGVAIPHSCRNGVCQTCMMQSNEANVPRAAQVGLKDTLQAQNYFLACVCRPLEDMTISLPDSSERMLAATVKAIVPLNNDIVRVDMDCPALTDYRAGQFINLYRHDALSRSYSLASIPTDPHLHIHVRRLSDGRMSNWIHDELKAGDSLQISAPIGSCFYLPGNAEQPLLLIGTGSGLAPLMGILRDALQQAHSGDIYLYHGSRDLAGLYLIGELETLASRYPHFHYIPCVSNAADSSTYTHGRAVDVALAAHPDLSGWRVYVCGNPDMVKTARKKAYLARAAMRDIYADAFIASAASPVLL